jgi:hypothetical protein
MSTPPIGSSGSVEFIVRFRAAEFEQWKLLFYQQQDLRVKHGATGHRLCRLVGDAHDFEAVISFTSLGGAQGYAAEVSRYELQRQAAVEGGGHHRVHWDEAIRETIDAARYE